MKVHNILKLISYQMIGKVFVSTCGVIATMILTRQLGVKDFGVYNFVLTFVYFAFLLADFGIEPLVTRDTASNKNSTPTYAQARVYLIGMTCVILACVLWALPYGPIIRLSILVAAIGQSMLLLTNLLNAVLQGHIQFGRIVIVQIHMALLQLALFMLGAYIHAGIGTYVGMYSIIMGIGFMSTWLASRRFLKSFTFSFDPRKIFSTLKSAWPFAISLLVTVAYFRIDTLILGYFFKPELKPDVGIYSLAYKPFEVMIVLGGYVTNTIFPVLVQQFGTKTFMGFVKKYVFITFIASCGVSAFLWFAAPFIVEVLGGPGFEPSVEVLRILSFAAGATVMAGLSNGVLLAGHKEKAVMAVSTCALIVNVVLNILFVPLYSYGAASWSTTITQTILLLGSGMYAFKILKNYES